MTWRNLMYQLNQWDKKHPNLLDQPAMVQINGHYDDTQHELDCIDHIDIDGEDSTDERITENTMLIATP